MSLKEILEKEVFTIEDIQAIFCVKRSSAYSIMKAIHSVSDRVGVKGRCHRKDYEDYINRIDREKK